MSGLLDILGARGLLQDATPDLGGRLAQGPVTGYCGFDPTSDSLHVGNLVPVMGLAWLQRTGGRPLVVVGGGTALVGDPSGKRSERPMLDPGQVATNAEALRGQLSRFLDFEGPHGAGMFNNADWLSGVGLLDFLRDTGKHFTVNYMLQKESVRNRMDAGISFTEFAYMLVQAYDFEHLYRTAGCELQLGGSDQWGNITAGIELVSRRHQAQVHGLTLPLLTTASGAKFGKSEDGNVWLDPTKTSPYRFYQYWINQDDRDVERLLRCFTFLPDREITELATAHAANPQAREAQRRLAADVTARVHGDELLAGVEAASRILFGGGEIGGADAATLAVVAAEVATAPVGRDQLGSLTVVEGLVATGLASSKADARRGIQGGGYSLNGVRLEADRALESADLLGGRYVVLQRGRRNYALLILD